MFKKALFVTAIAATAVVMTTTATSAMAATSTGSGSPRNPLQIASPLVPGIHSSHFSKIQGDAASTNALLNSDIEILTASSSDSETIAAEGHLRLYKTHGGSYSGFFYDNVGDHTYSASATKVSTTTENGKYTIHTRNGKFTFTYTDSSTTGTAPSKYGKKAQAGLEFAAHKYTKVTDLSFATAQFKVGGTVPVTNGTLSLTLDTFGFIVPTSETHGVVSKYVYTQSGHKRTSDIHAWGVYETDDSSPEFLIVVIKLSGKTFHFISNQENENNTSNELDGVGTAGPRGAASYVTFSLVTPTVID